MDICPDFFLRFGRGSFLVLMAKAVGKSGKVYGIDLSPKMYEKAIRKLASKSLLERASLILGDARKLPYQSNFFDLVYISSTLELFDTPIIPVVLSEIKRVLKKSGRLAVISIPKKGRENSFGVKFFEWIHRIFPKYASCRPIYIESLVKQAGFEILLAEVIGSVLPMKLVIAVY